MAAIAKAQRALSIAQAAVFEAVDDNRTRFRECLDKASPEQRAAYRTAADNLARLEQEAVNAGQAWRGAAGGFYFNHR